MDRYKYYLNLGLESSWLTVAFILPLLLTTESSFISQDMYSRFEVPKTVFLKAFAAIILIIWILKESTLPTGTIYSVFTGKMRLTEVSSGVRRVMVVAVVLLILSTLIATIGSSSIETSLWGHQPGNDPFSLYSIVSYGILFGAIATNLKTNAQLSRLLNILVVSATTVAAYGIFEFFGLDFLNTNETENFTRISSTLGNSLIAGSFFVISIGIGFTTLFHKLNSVPNNPTIHKFWIALLSSSIIFQLAALFFTGSRGPFVAFIFLVGLFGIGAFAFNRLKIAIRNVMVLGTILILGLGVIVICDLVKPDSISQTSISSATSQIQDSDTSNFTRVASIPGVVSDGGLNGRIYTWSNTIKMSLQRPPLEQGKDYGKAIRFIVGYGPELMEFAFLKTAVPYGHLKIPATPDQAHNIFLQYLTEQGVVGLLAALFLFASPLFIIWTAFRYTDKDTRSGIWVIVGGSITLLAYGLEQQVGITKVTGFTLYFMLLGMIYATISIRHKQSQPAEALEQRNRFTANVKTITQLSTGLFLVVLISIITFTYNLDYLRAGFLAGDGAQAYKDGNLLKGYNLFNKAIQLSPRIPLYFHYQNSVLRQLADRAQPGRIILPPRCGIFTEPSKITECIYGEVYMNAKQAYLNNGYNWNTTFEAAEAALAIKRDQEAVSLYNVMVNQAPHSYPLRNHTGYIHYLLSDYPSAKTRFNESLELTGMDDISARTAMMYTGFIQVAQADPDIAYGTLMGALELFLEARAQDGYASDLQENKDILSISLELNKLAATLGKDPPVKIE